MFVKGHEQCCFVSRKTGVKTGLITYFSLPSLLVVEQHVATF